MHYIVAVATEAIWRALLSCAHLSRIHIHRELASAGAAHCRYFLPVPEWYIFEAARCSPFDAARAIMAARRSSPLAAPRCTRARAREFQISFRDAYYCARIPAARAS